MGGLLLVQDYPYCNVPITTSMYNGHNCRRHLGLWCPQSRGLSLYDVYDAHVIAMPIVDWWGVVFIMLSYTKYTQKKKKCTKRKENKKPSCR